MFKIGKRKIQEITGSKYVNIPKSWVEHVGLIKGDFVEFSLGQNEELIIRKLGGSE